MARRDGCTWCTSSLNLGHLEHCSRWFFLGFEGLFGRRSPIPAFAPEIGDRNRHALHKRGNHVDRFIQPRPRLGQGDIKIGPPVDFELQAMHAGVAARMALPMTRMSNYDAARQDRMRSALQTVQAGAGSSDLKEVVDKAL